MRFASDQPERCHECGISNPRHRVGSEPYCWQCLMELRERTTQKEIKGR